jgi:hypothetical protein
MKKKQLLNTIQEMPEEFSFFELMGKLLFQKKSGDSSKKLRADHTNSKTIIPTAHKGAQVEATYDKLSYQFEPNGVALENPLIYLWQVLFPLKIWTS